VHTRQHLARSLFIALAATLALVGIAGPVAAATPKAATIVSHVTFNPDGPNFGDFTASGPAVDAGVLCRAGTFADNGIRFAGFQGNNLVQLQVLKTFTCADGSGTFAVKMQIRADFNTGMETFNWVITDGSGAYDSLHGSGTGSTVPNAPIGNINTFEGLLLR